MRAMWLHYPKDTIATAIGNQYLWGKDMLIAPVFEKGATARKLYLPDGYWYDWWTNELIKGGKFISRPVDLSIMPIYVRAGGIIPIDPVRQFTGEVVTEPTTIRIYRGADGEFELYNDDGISLKYLQGKATITRFIWNEKRSRLTIEPVSDNYAADIPSGRSFIIELAGKKKTEMVTYKGQRIIVDLK
jgi:alpha-glucosidase (family GH31 glycosyl hydrolase)